MPYYSLRNDSSDEVLSSYAPNRDMALSDFAAEIGELLTFEDTGAPAGYSFGEREENVGWMKTCIPLFIVNAR
jgi:hypothetical protein